MSFCPESLGDFPGHPGRLREAPFFFDGHDEMRLEGHLTSSFLKRVARCLSGLPNEGITDTQTAGPNHSLLPRRHEPYPALRASRSGPLTLNYPVAGGFAHSRRTNQREHFWVPYQVHPPAPPAAPRRVLVGHAANARRTRRGAEVQQLAAKARSCNCFSIRAGVQLS
jgi:hypothetical protein